MTTRILSARTTSANLQSQSTRERDDGETFLRVAIRWDRQHDVFVPRSAGVPGRDGRINRLRPASQVRAEGGAGNHGTIADRTPHLEDRSHPRWCDVDRSEGCAAERVVR